MWMKTNLVLHINEPDLLRFLTHILLLADLALNIPYKTIEVNNLKILYVNKWVLQMEIIYLKNQDCVECLYLVNNFSPHPLGYIPYMV